MDLERLLGYLDSLDTGNTEFLNSIEREAQKRRIPVIRKDTQRFIKLLLAIKRPERILEVGTAVGFSALFMAEYNPAPCEIVTIEQDETKIKDVLENLKKAGREGQITLLFGDALSILPTLEQKFDFIFLDAAKGQYIRYLPKLLRVLPAGGILLADNVFFDGGIIESRFAVTRRDRTIHKRMRQYLYEVTHHDALISQALPIGDGLALSVKR